MNNGPKGVTLEANNLGKTWWKAEEELRELFEQEGSRKTKKHVGREVTVSGFNFNFYFSVKNLMYYYRVTGSECVPIEVIMSAAPDASGQKGYCCHNKTPSSCLFSLLWQSFAPGL